MEAQLCPHQVHRRGTTLPWQSRATVHPRLRREAGGALPLVPHLLPMGQPTRRMVLPRVDRQGRTAGMSPTVRKTMSSYPGGGCMRPVPAGMRQGGQYVFFITVCLLRMTICKVAALSVYQRQNRLAPSGVNGNIYFQGKAAYMRGTSSIICEGQVA